MGLHSVEARILNEVQNAGSKMTPQEYVALIDRVRAVLAVEASRCDEDYREEKTVDYGIDYMGGSRE